MNRPAIVFAARIAALFALILLAGVAHAGIPLSPGIVSPTNNQRNVPFIDTMIQWNPPASGTITAYAVWLGVDSEGASEIARVGPDVTTYTIPTALDNDTTYRFDVRTVDENGDLSNLRAFRFITKATAQPVNIYYYIGKDVTNNGTRKVTWVIRLLNNPDAALPAATNFVFEWDPAVLDQIFPTAPISMFSPRLNLTYQYNQNGLASNQFRASATDPFGNNTLAEGYLFQVEARVIGTLADSPLPFRLMDDPIVSDSIITANDSRIDHVYFGSLGSPGPSSPALVAPANGETGVDRMVKFQWNKSLFTTSYSLFVWPASGSKPGTPAISGTESIFSPQGDLLMYMFPSPLAGSTSFDWQIEASSSLGTSASAVFTFTTAAAPTLTPSMTPTMTLTPTPSTVPPTMTVATTTASISPTMSMATTVASPTAITPTDTPLPTGPTPTDTPLPTGPTPTISATDTPSPTASMTPLPQSRQRAINWLLSVDLSGAAPNRNGDAIIDAADVAN